LAEAAPFDFAFIDADKLSYPAYYEWVVEHLRPGGILAAHNALWGGAVVSDYQEGAIADMKAFNRMVAADARVSSTIYPAGDGTLVAVKIG
jgi:caffeoyl-CoA O-methyltransferase